MQFVISKYGSSIQIFFFTTIKPKIHNTVVMAITIIINVIWSITVGERFGVYGQLQSTSTKSAACMSASPIHYNNYVISSCGKSLNEV